VARVKQGFSLRLAHLFSQDGIHFRVSEVIPGDEEDIQLEIYDD
jgi:hypothetical protein